MWGRIRSWCDPTIFWNCSDGANNEPELPLREAAFILVALIMFVTLMAWAAMQWM